MYKEKTKCRELCELIGCKPQKIRDWRKEGAPEQEGGFYDTKTYLLWISKKNDRRSQFVRRAVELLGEQKKSEAPKPVKEPQAEPLPTVAIDIPQDLGLEAAVARLRTMELALSQNVQRQIADEDPRASSTLKQWVDTIELLRKSEDSVLEVLSKQKRLLPVDHVVEWIGSAVSTSKARMLQIPTKISPQLEGLEWADIQKILEKEIHESLESLSRPIIEP